MAVLFSDAVRTPEIAALKRNLFAERHELATPMVRRAIERGELPPGTSSREVIELVAGVLYYRLLVTGEHLDHEIADRAAELALAAVRSLY